MPQVNDVLAAMDRVKGDSEFLKTGFPTVDRELDGGFLRKELIVLGADTGIGKSAIAGQLFFNMAEQQVPCAYFSLEMANEMIVGRLLGAIANIKPTRIHYGLLDFEEQNEKHNAKSLLATMQEYMFFFDDKYTLAELVTAIHEHNFSFVIIDFIQNVMIPGLDEYARLSKAALELQKLAKEKNCCILLLSQLSNAQAKVGEEGRVEYKGSGSIATVCDLGFILTRTQNPLSSTDEISLTLKKNRRGMSRLTFPLKYKHPGGYICE